VCPSTGNLALFNEKIRALQRVFSKIVVEGQKLEDSGFFLSCFKSAEKAKLGFFRSSIWFSLKRAEFLALQYSSEKDPTQKFGEGEESGTWNMWKYFHMSHIPCSSRGFS
jgi:hypothetical protein